MTGRGTRGRLRELPLPLLLPLPPLSTRGRGGARHDAHPAPPRLPLSHRDRQVVADPVTERTHLLFLFRLLLLLLLILVATDKEGEAGGVHTIAAAAAQNSEGERRRT